ncbi:MAG: hypothetical protein ACJ77D_09405 [Chloroflexota bacterium]
MTPSVPGKGDFWRMRSLLVALVFLLAGCASAGVATTGSSDDVENPVEVTLEPGTGDELAAAPDPETGEPTQYKAGEPATVTSDGEDWAKIVVDKVKAVKRYNGPYDFDDVPKKGNVYIQLRVTYTALQSGVAYNPFDWQIFVGGEAGGNYTSVGNGPTPLLEFGTLPKGRKASGYLVYEVKAKGKVLLSYAGSFGNEAPIFEVLLRSK